ESANLGQLNRTDSLFGWIGSGQNQALTSRVSFNFARFEQPQLSWLKVPYPYGNWQFIDDQWQQIDKAQVEIKNIKQNWRYFPHVPLAPTVEDIAEFKPDTVKANYMRSILPGAKFRFSIRFWNLLKEELQRLIWCIVLEDNLAHKIGRARYLGMGSLKLRLTESSYLIDWEKRYTGQPEQKWHQPINVADWIEPQVISNHDLLREALNADKI
ncbi:MAG: hypothetical protein SCK70_15410, partial [bacterium]|nr:hypothetical protein [bacterium]